MSMCVCMCMRMRVCKCVNVYVYVCMCAYTYNNAPFTHLWTRHHTTTSDQVVCVWPHSLRLCSPGSCARIRDLRYHPVGYYVHIHTMYATHTHVLSAFVSYATHTHTHTHVLSSFVLIHGASSPIYAFAFLRDIWCN
jgi:hypothetical protein